MKQLDPEAIVEEEQSAPASRMLCSKTGSVCVESERGKNSPAKRHILAKVSWSEMVGALLSLHIA